MNLMSAVLVNLWVAGWAVAMLRAALQARAAEIAVSSREKPVRESGRVRN
jgi:hypothetical protein